MLPVQLQRAMAAEAEAAREARAKVIMIMIMMMILMIMIITFRWLLLRGNTRPAEHSDTRRRLSWRTQELFRWISVRPFPFVSCQLYLVSRNWDSGLTVITRCVSPVTWRRRDKLAAIGDLWELRNNAHFIQQKCFEDNECNHFQLRYLQTLTNISAENNSTIVFPVPVDIISTFMSPSSAGQVSAVSSVKPSIFWRPFYGSFELNA